jgi:hypothetical protein
VLEAVLGGGPHGDTSSESVGDKYHCYLPGAAVLWSWLQAGIVEEVDPILLDKADGTVGENSVEEEPVRQWLSGLPVRMREEEAGWE